jgi:CRP/FNR family transcriptional regulator
MNNTVLACFPELKNITDEFGKKILESAQEAIIPAGVTVFKHGDQCQQYVLVCKGSVKVVQSSEGGREIVLYRVQAEESCVLTTTCLLSHEAYSATGITETEVLALVIPAGDFQQGLQQSSSLRDFVFKQYGKRLGDLLHLVNALAFGCLDTRLAQCLLQQPSDNTIKATHQDLANEIGSTREVISRRLKEFEHLGWVKLHRGAIDLCDIEQLRKL